MNKARFDKILTKSFLQKYYIKEKLSTYIIAKTVKCSAHTIGDYLKRFKIKVRTMEKDNNHNYIDGRCKNKYYCKEKDCHNEICSITYFKGSGRCRSCANLGERNSFYRKKHTRKTKKRISKIKRNYYKTHKSPMFGRKGNKHPAYIHGKGYEPYTTEFTQKLKDKIRQRDNYECKECKMIEEEHIMVYGRILEVHHIDYNKQNCDEDNLITLCKQCNIRANYNRKYWKKYYQEKIKNETYHSSNI